MLNYTHPHCVISCFGLSEPEADQIFNLTSLEVLLMVYLDSLINVTDSNTNNTTGTDTIGSSDELSAGAIAGIVVSATVILVLVIISTIGICLCKLSKMRYK